MMRQKALSGAGSPHRGSLTVDQYAGGEFPNIVASYLVVRP